MTAIPPFILTWDGDGLVPTHRRFKELCNKEFIVGEAYRVEVRAERSINSHNHYFASISNAWANLPEQYADRFPTPDHLRKYALIKAGFRDERSIACASKAEAQRVAAFVKPMDDFAIVHVSESLVTVFTAKSQSYKAMGRKAFQGSKDEVLDILDGMIGVDRKTAEAFAREAA